MTDDNGNERQEATVNWFATRDQSRPEVVVKVGMILKHRPSMRKMMEGQEDTRHDAKGDVVPSAISFEALKRNLKWANVDQAACWAWRDAVWRARRIQNDNGLRDAVGELRKRDVTSGRIELWNVVGLQGAYSL